MIPGISFLSSIKFRTHRQQCIADRDEPLDPLIIYDPGWQSRARSQVPIETANTTWETPHVIILSMFARIKVWTVYPH